MKKKTVYLTGSVYVQKIDGLEDKNVFFSQVQTEKKIDPQYPLSRTQFIERIGKMIEFLNSIKENLIKGEF